MTGSPRPPLTEAERKRITEAVAQAERGTRAEIVVIVAARCAAYRSAGLAAALLACLAVPWPLIALTALSAASIAGIQAGAALAVLALSLPLGIRSRLVPRGIRRARVREAARRAFHAHGLTETRGRTGVLIYVSLGERHAEILADGAVRARVPEETWRGVLADLLAAAGGGGLGEGLVRTVTHVGEVLTRALPATGTPNELPDRVIVLE